MKLTNTFLFILSSCMLYFRWIKQLAMVIRWNNSRARGVRTFILYFQTVEYFLNVFVTVTCLCSSFCIRNFFSNNASSPQIRRHHHKPFSSNVQCTEINKCQPGYNNDVTELNTESVKHLLNVCDTARTYFFQLNYSERVG